MTHQEFTRRWTAILLISIYSLQLLYNFSEYASVPFRYGFLLPESAAVQDPLSMSIAILHQFGILPEMYQIGYTKLYFRKGQVSVCL